MNYPSDWLCKHCNKIFMEHVQIGALNEDSKGSTPAQRNWCFSYSTPLGSSEDNEEHNWSFEPVDNLTQVELTAKHKNLI